jgi:hypothetical protein
MRTLPSDRLGPWLVRLALLLAVAVGGGGCRSRDRAPRSGPPYRYVIQVHPSLSDAEFQVDAIAVNASNRGRVEGSVTEHFRVPEAERPDRIVPTMVFSPAMNRRTIDLKDTQLRKYRYPGYAAVAIFANIPNAALVGRRNDPRRILLPLDRARWPRGWPGKKNEIAITISREGITADPAWIE